MTADPPFNLALKERDRSSPNARKLKKVRVGIPPRTPTQVTRRLSSHLSRRAAVPMQETAGFGNLVKMGLRTFKRSQKSPQARTRVIHTEPLGKASKPRLSQPSCGSPATSQLWHTFKFSPAIGTNKSLPPVASGDNFRSLLAPWLAE